MNILLVADSSDSLRSLTVSAVEAGHRIVKLVTANDETCSYVESLNPDALIVTNNKIDKVILREIRAVMTQKPVPIVVLTRDSSDSSVDACVKAGVSLYMVDGIETERIDSLLRVAQAQFNQRQQLYRELEETKNALEERKRVEKAKGLIMKQKKITEDQAYNAMRKLAMDHNKRVADIAGQIIAAAEVLT